MRDSVFSGFFYDSIWILLGLQSSARIPGRLPLDASGIMGFHWDYLKKGVGLYWD